MTNIIKCTDVILLEKLLQRMFILLYLNGKVEKLRKLKIIIVQ